MAASIASNLRSTYAFKSVISCGTSFSGGTPDGATEGEVVNVPETSSATFVGPTGDDSAADALWLRDGPDPAAAVRIDAAVSGWALRRCVYGAVDALWLRDGTGTAPAVKEDAAVSGWAFRRCVYGAVDALWLRDGTGTAPAFKDDAPLRKAIENFSNSNCKRISQPIAGIAKELV
uniref:Uncharacterized protein n=1 Tax=Anopheles coluzzii TaxID=1518534 RepID=A0A8W7PGP3_ANOCL